VVGRAAPPLHFLLEGAAGMTDLGQWLREAREAKDLSLAEVEAQTRIRQKFLVAMEAETWDSLPNEAVAVGFLRKYAAFLGLDTAAVMDLYRARSAKLEAPVEEIEMPGPREVDYRPIEVDLSAIPRPQVPWGVIAGIAGVAVLVLGLWWLSATDRLRFDGVAASLPGGSSPGQATSVAAVTEPTATVRVIRVTATPSPTPVPSATPTLVATIEPTPEAVTDTPEATPEAATPTPAEQEGAVAAILLQLAASQRSWVRVVVDGQTVAETVFEPGQTGEWQGQEAIVLRTGNAAGIDLVINGEPQASLGGTGEVVDKEWTLVDGRVTGTVPAATPAPSAG
jgi:cytoskeletal protein RodZ